MADRSQSVTDFLNDLDHPFGRVLEVLRSGILAVDPGITEQIKWKAPSFCYAGADRVTFNLRPTDRLQVILHRGTKTRDDAAGFAFRDESGLIEWITPDRGTVSFSSAADAEQKQEAFLTLVGRWVKA
jgi:hypothetical protein